MAWLVNSMKPLISKTYLFMPIAKDIWEAAREIYSDTEDSSQIFEIKTRLWQMKQGDKDVTKYCMVKQWDCPGDGVRYKKRLENERVYEFLVELNRELDDVRSRILSRRPLPPTREVFAEVKREESRQQIMLKNEAGPNVENSTLVTHSNGPIIGSNPSGQTSINRLKGISEFRLEGLAVKYKTIKCEWI